MNAYDTAPKGETYEHPLIRIETNRPGLEGIGAGVYAKPDERFFTAVKSLIDKDTSELFEMKDGTVVAPGAMIAPLLAAYPYLDGALLDLTGKALGRPVWQLLGTSIRDRVQAYDDTLYFADIVHPNRGVSAVIDECKESVGSGYSGLKLKLGRNLKWMPPEPGRARHIEIFPETVDDYARLKDKIQTAGMKTRIADGENLQHAISSSSTCVHAD